VVFETADRRLPWILALGITYGLPRMFFSRGPFAWVSKFYSASGCLVTQLQVTDCLETLSTSHSWVRYSSFDRPSNPRLSEADRLGLASSWGMIRAFVFNSPYPTAPFSTLYLFGRGQDIGFPKGN